MECANTVAVVVPSPAISLVFEATSWTRLDTRQLRWLHIWHDVPSTEVLKLVLELNRLGYSHTICRATSALKKSKKTRQLTLGDLRTTKALLNNHIPT